MLHEPVKLNRARSPPLVVLLLLYANNRHQPKQEEISSRSPKETFGVNFFFFFFWGGIWFHRASKNLGINQKPESSSIKREREKKREKETRRNDKGKKNRIKPSRLWFALQWWPVKFSTLFQILHVFLYYTADRRGGERVEDNVRLSIASRSSRHLPSPLFVSCVFLLFLGGFMKDGCSVPIPTSGEERDSRPPTWIIRTTAT